MKKESIKKYIAFIIGLLFFGFGISFGIKSGFGNNPMGVFITGVAEHVSLNVGICNMLLGLFETLVGYILDKKNVNIGTLIIVFCGSYFIDLGMSLIPFPKGIIVRILYMIIGIVLFCLGFSFQQYARCGLSNYDCFIFGIGKLLKTNNYARIRLVCDLFFIVAGYLLGGVVGIATLILVLFSGKIIVFFTRLLKRNNK